MARMSAIKTLFNIVPEVLVGVIMQEGKKRHTLEKKINCGYSQTT